MRWSEATEGTGRGEGPAGRGSAGRRARRLRLPAALLAAAAGAALAWACARPSAPPGAEEEAEPPGIRSLFPAPDTVIEELAGPARIQFDEPIRGGARLGRQLVASPAYRYSVSVGHSEISIRPEGGWRPGAVYVFELPAGISDLLNNAREEPVRMVFSTGPPIRPTLVRAQVFDRVTGERHSGGRLLLLSASGDSVVAAGDTVPYTAVADSTGVHSRRHVPPGAYWAYGFVDQNRNRRLDRRLEPYDSARVALDSDSAVAEVNFFTLQRDSTPPRLGRIEARDSVTVRLVFDDYLRPGHRPGGLLIYPAGGGDGIPARGIRVLTAEDTLQEEADSAGADSTAVDSAGAAGADSLAGDSVAADTVAGDSAAADTTPPDTPAADSPGADSARADSLPADSAAADSVAVDSAAADTMEVDKPPRPTRILEIRLEEPLSADTFRIQFQRLRNMWGLSTDVDTTFGYEPPPDSVRADTVSGDSTAADSAVADPSARDSVVTDSVAADSVPADSSSADTAGVGEP